MLYVSHSQLEEIATEIFVRFEAPEKIASQVAASLVEANLQGMDSHGILQVSRYVEKIRAGRLFPAVLPKVEHTGISTAIITGGYGFGQITAYKGVEVISALTKETGVASVALRDVNHVGRLGEYAEQLAKDGLISMIMAGGGDTGGQVTPYGGKQRMFGTNPICWGIPTPGDPADIIVDFATAAIATGKMLLAKKTGAAIPAGCLLDAAGNPSIRPDDYYEGGVMLPFGAHKGYAIMLVIEILANLFGGCAPLSSKEHKLSNTVLMTAWSIERFVDRERFDELILELYTNIQNSEPTTGFESVRIPGEIEQSTRKERLEGGIPIPDEVWRDLCGLI